MTRYTAKVAETVISHVRYAVDAGSPEEARGKMEDGETVSEDHIKTDSVAQRTLLTEPEAYDGPRPDSKGRPRGTNRYVGRSLVSELDFELEERGGSYCKVAYGEAVRATAAEIAMWDILMGLDESRLGSDYGGGDAAIGIGHEAFIAGFEEAIGMTLTEGDVPGEAEKAWERYVPSSAVTDLV